SSSAFLHSRYNNLPASRLTLTQPYGQFLRHWDVQGKVTSTNDEIRLTPAIRGVTGAIWSKTRLDMKAFGLEMDFRLTSNDGLHAGRAAIWLVDRPTNGAAYGASSNFKGIGIVLDTFQSREPGASPFIGIIASDGTTVYSNGEDITLGRCKASGMVRADNHSEQLAETISVYVEYLGSVIRVFYKYPSGEWAYCTDAQAHIPSHFVLGVSAASGELPSRHDLLSLQVFEMEPSFEAAVEPDELRFETGEFIPRFDGNDDFVTTLFAFATGFIAIVLLFAAVLLWDYYNDYRLVT
ncbi:hypothetical protein PFISCL1PPCAC_7014, partial [Pristionchus fissidentatus]